MVFMLICLFLGSKHIYIYTVFLNDCFLNHYEKAKNPQNSKKKCMF